MSETSGEQSMADVNRGNRPLSPHLSIYRLPLAAMMSILHRITGVAMMLAAMMVVWWFLAASTSEGYFQFADDLITSWIGGLILLLSAFAFWYHFCTGVRHIFWDLGYGFEKAAVDASAYVVLGAAGLLSLITLFFIW